MISQSRIFSSLTQTLCVSALLVPSLASASIITYTDQAAFLAAAQQIPNTITELDTFDSSTPKPPDITVQTWTDWPGHIGEPGYGHVSNGVWDDCVGKVCGFVTDSFTKWIFAKPAYAFGATFNYGDLSYPITDIGISFGYNWINPPLQNGFFGFISSTPIGGFTVTEDVWTDHSTPGLPIWAIRNAQAYTMDNMYVQIDPPGLSSPAPEPATSALIAMSLLLLCILARRRGAEWQIYSQRRTR